jgi:hypothetical protein
MSALSPKVKPGTWIQFGDFSYQHQAGRSSSLTRQIGFKKDQSSASGCFKICLSGYGDGSSVQDYFLSLEFKRETERDRLQSQLKAARIRRLMASDLLGTFVLQACFNSTNREAMLPILDALVDFDLSITPEMMIEIKKTLGPIGLMAEELLKAFQEIEHLKQEVLDLQGRLLRARIGGEAASFGSVTAAASVRSLALTEFSASASRPISRASGSSDSSAVSALSMVTGSEVSLGF